MELFTPEAQRTASQAILGSILHLILMLCIGFSKFSAASHSLMGLLRLDRSLGGIVHAGTGRRADRPPKHRTCMDMQALQAGGRKPDPVVHKGGNNDCHMEQLVRMEGDVEGARLPPFWDAHGIYKSTPLQCARRGMPAAVSMHMPHMIIARHRRTRQGNGQLHLAVCVRPSAGCPSA